MPFPEGISLKENVRAPLEFELAYFEAADQQVSHYITWTLYILRRYIFLLWGYFSDSNFLMRKSRRNKWWGFFCLKTNICFGVLIRLLSTLGGRSNVCFLIMNCQNFAHNETPTRTSVHRVTSGSLQQEPSFQKSNSKYVYEIQWRSATNWSFCYYGMFIWLYCFLFIFCAFFCRVSGTCFKVEISLSSTDQPRGLLLVLENNKITTKIPK